MSTKELVLLPKQKYNSLMNQNHPMETVSVQTQTDERADTPQECMPPRDVKVENNNTPTETSTPTVTSDNPPVLAVRSVSWDRIPGKRPDKTKRKTKTTVNWIPY